MPRFPPPQDEAFLMLNGAAVPVKDIPKEEWEGYVAQMMKRAGKVMSSYYATRVANGEISVTFID